MKIIYWIFTGLLIALMLFSAVGSFFPNPEGEAMMRTIGYPYSVLHLLAVAKVLGAIALLVPGYPLLKEWAYAGFTFDLIGAIYAFLIVGTPVVNVIFMLVGLVFVFGSYYYHHQILKERGQDVFWQKKQTPQT